ncbi:MAG: hypothetical protein ABR587_16745, partial [Candidatus Binatia bacterium]
MFHILHRILLTPLAIALPLAPTPSAMPSRLSNRATAVLRSLGVSILLGLASQAHADVDLTGRWYYLPADSDFADIVQTGSAVTISWTQTFSGQGPLALVFTGTFDQTHVSASWSGTAYLSLDSITGGTVLVGSLAVTGTGSLSPAQFIRCGCDDGNRDDGDGCDSRCQVETCFQCSGDPSVCVPSPDSTACNDFDDCTLNESCSAGACGNGIETPSCISMTGLWRVTAEVPDFDIRSVSVFRFVQDAGELSLYSEADPIPWALGSVDSSTGAFEYSAFGNNVFCPHSSTLTGTV